MFRLDSLVFPRMAEEKFCITERVIPRFTSTFQGIRGILKHRSTDFVVEEMDLEGNVVEYSPELIYCDPALQHCSKETNPAEAFAWNLEEKEKIAKELDLLFQDSRQLVYETVIEDKDHRKRIHLYFKSHFDGRLVTDVVSPQNYFRISVKSRSGGARSASYDHRNNQGPNDPRPVPFLQFSLWKDGLDTMEAVQTLARRLNLPAKSFSYAGTKDRRAVSTQRVVVRNILPARIAGINKMSSLRIKVSHLKAVESPLRFGDLTGNRFTIILRNTQHEAASSHQAIELLSEHGFINYFGLQRFGRGSGDVSTDSIGKALLENDFKLACSLILDPRPDESNAAIAKAREVWKTTGDASRALEAFPHRCSAEVAVLQHFQRQGSTTDFQGAIGAINRELRLMYLHAVQSAWWNAMATERIKKFGLNVVAGDLVQAADETIATATEDTKQSFSIFQVVLPIVGYNTILPANEIGDFIRDLTHACPQITDKSKSKTNLWDLPGGYRSLLQRPKDLKISTFAYSEGDELISVETKGPLKAVQLQFALPTSCYATMLLRELFPEDMSTSADYHKSAELK